jgi:tetrahydromethanopterin S-methyltransferase subunit F
MKTERDLRHADWSRIDERKRELQSEYMHGFVFGFVCACLLMLVFGL